MSNITEVKQLSSSQRLLLTLDKAVTKLEAVERAKTEPIAIVGLSCRFPGRANNPEAFWQLLRNGVDAISEVPKERWDIDRYYDPDPDAPGKMYTRYGGFLDRVDEFDPLFFGISPREAANLDPQQRLLLEVSWEALENGGQVPAELAGSKTGVFVGITTNDYARLLVPHGDLSQIDAYFLAGNPLNAVAGRLSYTLGLQGPSIALDTACSSSLVSVHLAVNSLRSKESNMALAGGVNLILSPENTVALCRARMMAADGRCKTFDAAANGFVRGEGCGVLLLKRYSDAVAAGDNILALIRGSGVNQDGLSSGFTVPNKIAQENLIRQVLATAKVNPNEVDYIEAHGTGTSLGDPIEVKALAAVLGEERSSDNPIKIGSVKSNIGHLESSAGVAGLIKTILSLQHEEIPPHLHFNEPNPYINWNELPVEVITKLIPWERNKQKRLAGVSSFGASGTNAHILLEEAPLFEQGEFVNLRLERPWHLLTLSARSESALQELVQRYVQFLESKYDSRVIPTLADISFSASTSRSHFQHRLCLLAANSTEAHQKLSSWSKKAEVTGIFTGTATTGTKTKIAFLFTGQGSQYVEMGKQLYENEPVFRETLDRCNQILRLYLDKPLLEIIYPIVRTNSDSPVQKSEINQTAYTQPAIFALEYSLYQLWQSWGITPNIVMGHSVGEYVAACVAGVFSLEDGLKLMATRGKLMQALPSGGEMVAILADSERVKEAIQPDGDKIAIAALNSSTNTVISGEAEAVRSVCTVFETAGVKTKKLEVSHAFHSPLMEAMLSPFREVASQISYSQPKLNLVSNLTGKLATEDIATSEYWVRHVREPVKFAASMTCLDREGITTFVEIGAHPILLGMARCCLSEDANKQLLPSLRRRKQDELVLLESLAQLYLQGVEIDWSGFYGNSTYQKVVLPTYPFQRQRYWVKNKQQNDNSSTELVSTPILQQLHQGDTQKLLQQIEAEGELSAEEVKYLPKLLEVLVTQHQKHLATVSIPEWLYGIQWQKQERSSTPSNKLKPGESWLILADRNGVGKALAQLLSEKGQNCQLVYYSQNNSLLESIDRSRFERIIHLWSLDTVSEDISISELEQAQILGCASTLDLLQALVKQQKSSKLWLITQEAVPVNSNLSGLAQSPLWGLGKVIALEHPELWGGLLDIDSNSSEVLSAQNLLAEIINSQGEEQIALRGEQRYVSRLVSSSAKIKKTRSIQPGAAYLITGGLGALGLKIAQKLVEGGAKNLILFGRSEPSTEAEKIIAQLKTKGINIDVVRGDVSNLEDMQQILEPYIQNSENSCQDEQPSAPTSLSEGVLKDTASHISFRAVPSTPLKGIFHTAGVLKDGILLQQDWQSFERVMAAKVKGAWILHLLTRELPLDFFVSFSSAAALLGSPGQGNYAAANSFLDALAYYRRGLGLAGLSINWGPWAKSGMAASLDDRDRAKITERGMESISIPQGLELFARLISGDDIQVGVLPIDWSKFLPQFPQIPPFLASFAPNTQETPSKQNIFLQQLKQASERDRSGMLIDRIRSQIAKVMELDSIELIDTKTGFTDLGMDSLMAVELRNHLQNSLGLAIPASIVFDYPNVEALADYLAQQVLKSESDEQLEVISTENEEPEITTEDIDDLDLLSDSEAEELLLGKLDSMRY